MTTRLRRALQEHASQFRLAHYGDQRSPWVFHHLFGERAGLRMTELRTAVESAATKATLPADWRLHDLRHRRVTTWLGEGHSPVLVKEAMGRASLQTTMGYTHLAREHLGPLQRAGRVRFSLISWIRLPRGSPIVLHCQEETGTAPRMNAERQNARPSSSQQGKSGLDRGRFCKNWPLRGSRVRKLTQIQHGPTPQLSGISTPGP